MSGLDALLFLKVLCDIERKKIGTVEDEDEGKESDAANGKVSHFVKIYMQEKHGKGGSLGSKRYACYKCSCLFRRKRHLRKHLQICCSHKCLGCSECVAAINKSYQSLAGKLQTSKTGKSFTCSSCNCMFHTKAGLAVHEEFHPQPGQVLQCESCLERFDDRQALHDHQKTHVTSEVHKCSSCSKAFTTHSNLAKHIQIRHKKKQGNFGDHFLAFLGEEGHEEEESCVLFTCDICEVVCSSDDELTVHVRRHFSKDGVRCLECTEICETKDNLLKHMLVHRQNLSKSKHKNIKTNSSKKNVAFSSNLENFVEDGFCSKCSNELPCSVHEGEVEEDSGKHCNMCDQVFRFRCHNAIHLCKAFPPIEQLDEKVSEENNFQCPACSKAYTCFLPLKLHCEVHRGEDPQYCRICNKTFSAAQKMDYHWECHARNTCTKCGVFFSKKLALLLHDCGVTQHKYTCLVCSEVFGSKCGFKKHWKIHPQPKEPQFKCLDCNQLFLKESNFRAHRMRHTGSYPFSCTLCDDKFLTYRTFKTHSMEHLDTKILQCDKCDKILSSQLKYVQHLRTHKKDTDLCDSKSTTSKRPTYVPLQAFECDDCGMVFRRQYKLLWHKKEVHNENVLYLFTCEFCSRGFYDKQHLKMHEDKCADRDEEKRKKCLEILKRAELKKEDPGPFTCSVCGKMYVTKLGFDDHMFSHRDNSEYPHQCPTCSRGYIKERYMKLHAAKCKVFDPNHPDIFKCKLCGASFKTTHSFTRHKKGHELELTCTVCNAKFITSQGLNKHMAACTPAIAEHKKTRVFSQGKKSQAYSCPKCERTFAFKHRYLAHVGSHDGLAPYKCETCEKQFLSKTNLIRHKCKQKHEIFVPGVNGSSDYMKNEN